MVNWSLSPGTAGHIDSKGLFTAGKVNTGEEIINAEYCGLAAKARVIINEIETGTVTDIDGNVYKTVKIGGQWWMQENLKVTHYRNGDEIPNITDKTEYANLSNGAYCNYGKSNNNSEIYGCLYNFYSVIDSRKLAPEGWHVPTDQEWKDLEQDLGMSQQQVDSTGERGNVEGGMLKEAGTSHWKIPNTGAFNQTKFTALPGGF